MKNSTAKHIVALYLESTPADRAHGRAWYLNAHATAREVQAISGHGKLPPWTLRQAACVISALSPSNKWERNVEDAMAVARWYAADIGHNPPKVCTYGANADKAFRIASAGDGADFLSMLGKGKKTLAFARLIERPSLSHVVVIDRHAFRAYRGEEPGPVNLMAGDYERAEYGYLKATDELYEMGEFTSETPAQLQAICWVAYKRKHGA